MNESLSLSLSQCDVLVLSQVKSKYKNIDLYRFVHKWNQFRQVS